MTQQAFSPINTSISVYGPNTTILTSSTSNYRVYDALMCAEGVATQSPLEVEKNITAQYYSPFTFGSPLGAS
jgi:hypothetical protein